MKTEWTFRRLNQSTKDELRSYWAKKESRLERLLGRFPEALRDLTVAVARQTAPDRLAVRAALHLPTRTLVAEVIEREPNEVLDKLCDVLAGEIKRHRDQLRREKDFRRNGHGADKAQARSNGTRQPWPTTAEPLLPATGSPSALGA
jgi:ribosome-associated translation inhibitor RaiA